MLLNWQSASWALYDHATAAAELRLAVNRNPPDDDELCRAVRWLAGPEAKQEKAPSLRELTRAVFILRKKARIDRYAPANGEKCGLCNDTGWLTVWPENGPDMTFADKLDAAVDVAYPCLCYAGSRARDEAEKGGHIKMGDITAMQELGRAQRQSIERTLAAEGGGE
jgi:hypothetical protein